MTSPPSLLTSTPLGVARPHPVRQPLLPPALRGWVIPATLVLLWELLSRFGGVPANLLPAPTTVLITITDLSQSGDLFRHIGITLYRVGLGFGLGTLVATVLGSLTGYSRQAYAYLDPLLQALRNIPSIAWVPLFILWLGIYESSKVTLIAVGVFFPVYLNLMSGIQGVDRKLVEVGKIYRLTAEWAELGVDVCGGG